MPSVHLLLVLLVSTLSTTIYGDNGEVVPLGAPANLTVLDFCGRQVVFDWDRDRDAFELYSVRGNFTGYLIRVWNDVDSQVYIFPPDVPIAWVKFFPSSKNFITVSVRYDKYVGPSSEAVSFDAPQIVSESNLPSDFNIFPLSDKAVFLQWSKPSQPDAIFVGYKIYYSEINEKFPGVIVNETWKAVFDPDRLQTKLSGLKTGVRYLIGISILTCAGESDMKTTEVTLQPHTPTKPSPSRFIYHINHTAPGLHKLCYKPLTTEETSHQDKKESNNHDYRILNEVKSNHIKENDNRSIQIDYQKRCIAYVIVYWLPDVRNNPGEYFYLKYRIKGEDEFQVTDIVMTNDNIWLFKLDVCKNYEIILTAVDGDYSTDSDIVVTPAKIF